MKIDKQPRPIKFKALLSCPNQKVRSKGDGLVLVVTISIKSFSITTPSVLNSVYGHTYDMMEIRHNSIKLTTI